MDFCDKVVLFLLQTKNTALGNRVVANCSTLQNTTTKKDLGKEKQSIVADQIEKFWDSQMPLYDRFVRLLTMVEKNTFVIIQKTYYFSIFNKHNGIGRVFFSS